MNGIRHTIFGIIATIALCFPLALVKAETVNINPPTTPIPIGGALLKYSRSLSVPRLTIPGTFVMTDTVRNVGDLVATNVVVTQSLPPGWTANGSSTISLSFGDIAPTVTQSLSTTITVTSASVPGRYANEATVSASGISPLQADQPIDLTKPAVLGASTTLAETGTNATPFLIFGLLLMVTGVVLRRPQSE